MTKKRTDGGHKIPEEDLREMEQEEGREMPDGVESQTGYCRFCGQAGMVHTLTGWSQEDVDEAVTCKCECDAAKKYAESKERVQKAKSRITELFGSTAERPIDQDVVKSTILYAGNGVDFCGYIHHPTYRKVRKGSVRRLKKDVKHLKAGELDQETFNRKYQSRLGHMGHADTYHVTKAIEYDLLFWEFEQTQSGLLVPV